MAATLIWVHILVFAIKDAKVTQQMTKQITFVEN